MSSIYIPAQPDDARRLGYTPRRHIGYTGARKRVTNLRVAQGLSAAAVPASCAAAGYPWLAAPFYLTDLDSFYVFLTAMAAVSGTPAGVQLVVQMCDGYSNFQAAPISPVNVTLLAGATTGVIAQPVLVQNFGELVAVGLQATAPWAGGTLALTVKGKG